MRKYKKIYQWQKLDEKEPEHICAKSNCGEEGFYRAPISRFLDGKYQYFCLEHIKEFNKSWNYFEGMNDTQFAYEIERGRLGGETWPMGLHNAAKHIHFNAERMKDPFDLFERKSVLDKNSINSMIWPDVSIEEVEAMALLQLEPPFDRPSLRNAYRKMARIFHPDSSDSQGDTDTIKKINQAYDILKKLLQRYEKT